MLNTVIALGATVTIFVIAFVVGGYAMTSVWHVPEQIVQSSGNAQLQATYPVAETVVSNASDGYDIWHTVKAIGILVGLPIGGYSLIWFLREIEIL